LNRQDAKNAEEVSFFLAERERREASDRRRDPDSH
jgi:hypothetical protein